MAASLAELIANFVSLFPSLFFLPLPLTHFHSFTCREHPRPLTPVLPQLPQPPPPLHHARVTMETITQAAGCCAEDAKNSQRKVIGSKAATAAAAKGHETFQEEDLFSPLSEMLLDLKRRRE